MPVPLLGGIEAATLAKDTLAAFGMPRNSNLSGGEITGWTTASGSTGFSLRAFTEDDSETSSATQIDWHIVISGNPHLEYLEENDNEEGESYHDPINPEVLYPRIKAAFESLGVAVQSVRHSGHQRLWDDDVYFNLVTNKPDWLCTEA